MSTTKRGLLIDFDKTLFDSDAFAAYADDFLARKYGVEKGRLLGRKESFYIKQADGSYIYDGVSHWVDTSGKDWKTLARDIREDIISMNASFAYEDAPEFLRKAVKSGFEVQTLTYGVEVYQLFKISLYQEISEYKIPVDVVRRAKRDFIHDNLKGREGILVDDRYPQNLPGGWVHVWVDRSPGDGGFIESDGERRVHSLSEIDFSKL